MKFKLIIVMTQDELSDRAIETAREHGATGSTVITSARGEGLKPVQSFLGLTVEGQRDMIMFLVEDHHCREIMEAISKACNFETEPGTGVAFQIDIEDAIGLSGQIKCIKQEICKGDL